MRPEVPPEDQPVPEGREGLESLSSSGEESYLGKRCHNEVLSMPAVKDRGLSGVLTVGSPRAWVERGWVPEK